MVQKMALKELIPVQAVIRRKTTAESYRNSSAPNLVQFSSNWVQIIGQKIKNSYTAKCAIFIMVHLGEK